MELSMLQYGSILKMNCQGEKIISLDKAQKILYNYGVIREATKV